MSKKLIVVADDFGFSEAYNYGVIKAYKEGVVCTLSLMSNMAAVPHAVKLWQSECPEVPLVQHTNFVQYRPVSAPEKVPTLVNEEGMFYRSYLWKSENPNDAKARAKFTPAMRTCIPRPWPSWTGTKNLWDIIPGILRATAP